MIADDNTSAITKVTNLDPMNRGLKLGDVQLYVPRTLSSYKPRPDE